MRAKAAIGLWLAGLAAAQPVAANPGFAEVRAAWRPSDVIVLDRHGTPLQRVRQDKRALRLDWLRLADTSAPLRYALLLSEDRRFYQHSGVDWSGVAAAAWAGSSCTM